MSPPYSQTGYSSIFLNIEDYLVPRLNLTNKSTFLQLDIRGLMKSVSSKIQTVIKNKGSHTKFHSWKCTYFWTAAYSDFWSQSFKVVKFDNK